MNKILVRFDDICPTMDFEQFARAEKLFEQYNIKPLLGVIPECKDPVLQIEPAHKDFWDWILSLQKKGYKIAMHGCFHVYDIEKKGIVNNGTHSEFAGHTYEEQLEKIRYGKKILSEHGITTDTFFAPSHSYDLNTLRALKAEGFKYLSDGRTKKPVMRCGLKCLPCRSFGIPRNAKRGLHTAVMHAHEWRKGFKEKDYFAFENFCKNYHDKFVTFEEYAAVPCGFYIIQIISERLCIFHGNYIMPLLSKIKHILIRK